MLSNLSDLFWEQFRCLNSHWICSSVKSMGTRHPKSFANLALNSLLTQGSKGLALWVTSLPLSFVPSRFRWEHRYEPCSCFWSLGDWCVCVLNSCFHFSVLFSNKPLYFFGN